MLLVCTLDQIIRWSVVTKNSDVDIWGHLEKSEFCDQGLRLFFVLAATSSNQLLTKLARRQKPDSLLIFGSLVLSVKARLQLKFLTTDSHQGANLVHIAVTAFNITHLGSGDVSNLTRLSFCGFSRVRNNDFWFFPNLGLYLDFQAL